MTILSILEGTNKVIIANIDLLANDYFEKTGRKLNKGCSSCVIEMVLTLKHFYNMAQFEFKRTAASYKNEKGDKVTISNSTMTDEKALKFLKTNPKRIELFSKYPKNWKKLIDGKIETEKERSNRIAIEAEAEAARVAEEKAAEEKKNVKPSKEDLMKMGLKDLRAAYPGIKATKTEDFVNKVLAL